MEKIKDKIKKMIPLSKRITKTGGRYHERVL